MNRLCISTRVSLLLDQRYQMSSLANMHSSYGKLHSSPSSSPHKEKSTKFCVSAKGVVYNMDKLYGNQCREQSSCMREQWKNMLYSNWNLIFLEFLPPYSPHHMISIKLVKIPLFSLLGASLLQSQLLQSLLAVLLWELSEKKNLSPTQEKSLPQTRLGRLK